MYRAVALEYLLAVDGVFGHQNSAHSRGYITPGEHLEKRSSPGSATQWVPVSKSFLDLSHAFFSALKWGNNSYLTGSP